MLLAIAGAAFSQHLDSANQFTPEYYLMKSRNQKSGAWVLTVAGTTGLLVTFLTNAANGVNDLSTSIISLGSVAPRRRSYAVPYVLSAACIGGGIALFTASSRNKNKYFIVSTNLKMEEAPVVQQLAIIQHSYPCLAVTLKL
jgi:hypothetical protein